MLRKDIVMKIEIEIPDDELKEVITEIRIRKPTA